MSLEIKENEPLKNHSTFKIGGMAKFFCVAKNKEEILEAINFAKSKNLPYFVFGGGSNILFRDKGFDGVAIQIKNLKFKIKNSGIEVGAGVLFSQLIMKSIEEGLSGLEWGVGIPGTIGGCVAGNCGAYGHSISESIESVDVLDENGNIKIYSDKECNFLYRESIFKSIDIKSIILKVKLKLKKGEREKSKEEMKNIIINRKGKIPLYPSIGSIFKNPPSTELGASKIPAKSLIEQCGLKGKRIGDAQVSDIHANFIVNLGNASSEDVLNLIEICKKEVKNKFNINLEEEIVVLQ